MKKRLIKAESNVASEISEWLSTFASDDEIIKLALYECSPYYDDFMVNVYYPMDELDEILQSTSPTDIILMT